MNSQKPQSANRLRPAANEQIKPGGCMSAKENHNPDPKAVATLCVAYDAALTQIVEDCGYLPPKPSRELIAAEMIAEAQRGEHDPERLKEAGLTALRQLKATPLALAFVAELVRSTRQALSRKAA
jgi:hypothetical protein